MTDPRELAEKLRDTSHSVRLSREAAGAVADAIDALADERDRLREVLTRCHDELALWFECADFLTRHGYCMGDTDDAMNAAGAALREGEANG